MVTLKIVSPLAWLPIFYDFGCFLCVLGFTHYCFYGFPWFLGQSFYPEDNVEVGAGSKKPEEAQFCELSGWSEFFLLRHTWARMSDGPQKGTTVNQEGLSGQQNHFIRDRVSAFHLPCPTPGHPPSSVLLSWSILLTFQPH